MYITRNCILTEDLVNQLVNRLNYIANSKGHRNVFKNIISFYIGSSRNTQTYTT